MTFQRLRLLNAKDKPRRNLATSKLRFLRQERAFFSLLFTTVAKRSFFNVASFLDPSLDCEGFVLYHVKISRLVPAKNVKMITKHANLLYAYLKTFLIKAGETFVARSIL